MNLVAATVKWRNIRDALEYISDEVKVELLDLFESSYGAFNTLAKKTYLRMVVARASRPCVDGTILTGWTRWTPVPLRLSFQQTGWFFRE